MGLGRFVWFVVDEYHILIPQLLMLVYDIHDLISHEMLRKKGKATQHDRTCPRQLFFKEKTASVGFEPTTVRLLGIALTN